MTEEIRKTLDDHEKRISALEKLFGKKPNLTLQPKKGTEVLLIEIKGEGFFNEGKTISEVHEMLNARGRIVKITDLPVYLLKLVRNETLKRAHKTVGKKRIWVYFA